jgi:hypothetical protein
VEERVGVEGEGEVQVEVEGGRDEREVVGIMQNEPSFKRRKVSFFDN